jgi:beta-1,4-N-acetylglucosaminyltransferase
MKKVCFTASSGGHYEQMMMLKSLMDKYESFIVTEKTSYCAENKNYRTYYLKQINRKEASCGIKLIMNTITSIRILLKEKPEVVVSTGVLSTIPICIIAKLFRKKLIYIESFAKVNSPTLTGKLMYKFADLFLVQWEEMKRIYPKALYVGGIY